MAKPSKLTDKLIDELCEWVADDVPFRYCAEGCGVLYNTFCYWMSKGEKDYEQDIDSMEAILFNRIKKAYAETVRKSVKVIKAGYQFKTDKDGNIICDKNWQGECWIRQRRDNEFMDKQEIVGDGEKVIVQLGNIKGRHIKNERDDNNI